VLLVALLLSVGYLIDLKKTYSVEKQVLDAKKSLIFLFHFGQHSFYFPLVLPLNTIALNPK